MTNVSYILIDYENVQPSDLDLVPNAGWHVKVFLGPKQNANHTSLNALQRLGVNCEYLSVSKPGPNALDFYIAYYLGTLARKKPEIYIISKDTGFDPLLEQLNQNGISARRCHRIAEISILSAPKDPKVSALPEMTLLQQAIYDLARCKDNKPATLKALHDALRVRFKLTDEKTTTLIDSLKRCGMIQVKAEKITYFGQLDLHSSASKAA